MTSRLLLEGLYAVKVISEGGPGPSATENKFSVYFEWLPVVRGFELSSLMSLFAKAPIIQFTLSWPQRLVSLHHSFPGSRQVELRCPSSHASDSSAVAHVITSTAMAPVSPTSTGSHAHLLLLGGRPSVRPACSIMECEAVGIRPQQAYPPCSVWTTLMPCFYHISWNASDSIKIQLMPLFSTHTLWDLGKWVTWWNRVIQVLIKKTRAADSWGPRKPRCWNLLAPAL